MGYECINCFEELPSPKTYSGTPEAAFFLTDEVIGFDNVKYTIKIFICLHKKQFDTPEQAYEYARDRIKSIRERLKKQPQYSDEECHQSWDAWGKQNDNAHRLPSYLTLTTEESQEVTDIKTKLSNYSDEMVYRFIFGEEDLESGWDGFVAQLKELGSERAEEIYKAAYDRYEARDDAE